MVKIKKDDLKKVMILALIAGIVIGIIIGVFAMVINNHKTSYEAITWKSIYVSSGDTLWTLCEEQYGTEKYDFRIIIDMVEDHNNLSGYLQPGSIEFPIFDAYEAGLYDGYQRAINNAEIIDNNTISFDGEAHWYK